MWRGMLYLNSPFLSRNLSFLSDFWEAKTTWNPFYTVVAPSLNSFLKFIPPPPISQWSTYAYRESPSFYDLSVEHRTNFFLCVMAGTQSKYKPISHSVVMNTFDFWASQPICWLFFLTCDDFRECNSIFCFTLLLILFYLLLYLILMQIL